ncbi:hypothetical protein MNB_SV-4-155 [hydrothermal vent metagenome]|uniref:Hemerythrin-like domain-containing protein n=1 Tax=hydrothermal vent metagenome TaxID=652676 RepID=A0A1W1EAV9_9ZZZZ
MFNFFIPKNKRMINKWHNEHIKIIDLIYNIVEEYENNNQKTAKKHIKQLNNLTVEHIMDEDIEFFRILKKSKNTDKETEEMIRDFVTSFKKTKLLLIKFLSHYSKPEVVLDSSFFKQFSEITKAVRERIQFEEKNVYSKLKEK